MIAPTQITLYGLKTSTASSSCSWKTNFFRIFPKDFEIIFSSRCLSIRLWTFNFFKIFDRYFSNILTVIFQIFFDRFFKYLDRYFSKKFWSLFFKYFDRFSNLFSILFLWENALPPVTCNHIYTSFKCCATRSERKKTFNRFYSFWPLIKIKWKSFSGSTLEVSKKNLISSNEKTFSTICWDTKKIQKITQKYNKTGKIRRVKKNFFHFTN